MHLYQHLAAPPRGQGRLAQEAPAIGVVSSDGVQELRDDVAGNVMMFLQNRYVVLDPQNTGVAGSTGYIAVTPESLNKANIQLEGLPTAAQQLQELPAANIALVSVNDTQAVLAAQPPELYHLVIVDSRAAAQTIGQAGSTWAVLKPRMGAGAGGAAPTSTSSSKGGLSAATLIGAAAGAAVGALVGGPVGAIVGGLAVGAIVNSTQS
jgi:hypothetical protein